MKVKANFDYRDLTLNRLVKKDEVIEVADERGNVLVSSLHNGVPFATVVEYEKPKRKNKNVEKAVPKVNIEKAVQEVE